MIISESAHVVAYQMFGNEESNNRMQATSSTLHTSDTAALVCGVGSSNIDIVPLIGVQ